MDAYTTVFQLMCNFMVVLLLAKFYYHEDFRPTTQYPYNYVQSSTTAVGSTLFHYTYRQKQQLWLMRNLTLSLSALIYGR